MRLRTAALPVAALSAVLAAACSGPAPAARPAAPKSSAGAAAASPAQARTVGGNMTVAAPGSLAPGPFKITPVYCGKLSGTQKQQFGTNADGGLVYKYENVSNGVTGEPKLEVNFTRGATVAGDNVSAGFPQVGPGQSAEGEADALNGSGGDLSFTGCEIVSYALITDSGIGAEYAG